MRLKNGRKQTIGGKPKRGGGCDKVGICKQILKMLYCAREEKQHIITITQKTLLIFNFNGPLNHVLNDVSEATTTYLTTKE
jgi:hypothetical protein